jgi:hypothetical protein
MPMTDERVKTAYVAWEQSRRELDAKEVLLKAALELHTAGGPLPLQLIGEVNALRTRTDDLFSLAVEAVRTRGVLSGQVRVERKESGGPIAPEPADSGAE